MAADASYWKLQYDFSEKRVADLRTELTLAQMALFHQTGDYGKGLADGIKLAQNYCLSMEDGVYDFGGIEFERLHSPSVRAIGNGLATLIPTTPEATNA